MIDQRTAPYGVLLLRLTLGACFIAHIYWKFFILAGGFPAWWQNLLNNHYPWFVPWYAFSAEVLGALLLIPGIGTRWVCLYALPLMIGAAQYWLVRKGYFFTGAGCELPTLWGILLVAQAFIGDGPYALVKSPVRWGPAR